ncbi:DUF11 domain-containing protein [Leucobacter rhizosphaerae]|uniref:DUF11 domain-containing protein n=1 Tax=Leucobacter rhizosphaerae TaxID=2932245 RepID=A0ABY4FVF1_9MICO|nr:DUF11 domain-containing protein [Leucobacter rhizosphaerae]UOQ60248.1 DUF11 domain-containing protein [Leucobacter rhizosphaerae]
MNLRAGTTFESCAQAQAGTIPAGIRTNNNDHSMRWNDTDGRSDTFNNSSAQFTIPAGATITYAMLEWAGHTGEFKTAGGNTSSISSCNIVGQQYSTLFPTGLPPAPAAATPEAQSPGVQINGAAPVEVTPHVTRDSGLGWPNNSDRMYTGWSDVTDLLESSELSGLTTVTVSNIWAPAGVNCTAGWGLTVVWAFDAPVEGVAEYQNTISIYQGHIRQGAADLPSTATFSGFEAASSTNRIGLVAYEGDRGTVGDRFSINGTDIPEPTGYGAVNDFFVSAGNISSDPAWGVNFSVDVNDFETDLIQAGDTEATLGFRTNGDGYWLQSVWLEAPIASVRIDKTADIAVGRPGDPVVWTITVSNPSPAAIREVIVTDPHEASCEREIPSSFLASGSFTYTCAGVLPEQTVTNTATVTARTELGTVLSAEDSATVEVIHPALSITKTSDTALALDGETVNFAITVHNTGDVDLSEVRVEDQKVPDCSADIGVLAAGAQHALRCSAVAPIAGGENSATAIGTDPLGNTLEEADTARMIAARPSLAVDKSVSDQDIRVGETATFAIAVTNDGNVRLDQVVLQDLDLAECSQQIGTLLPGETRTVSCSWTADRAERFVNTASASGIAMRCTGAEAPGTCAEELGIEPLVRVDDATVVVSTGLVGTPERSPGDDEQRLSATGGQGGGVGIAFGLACMAAGAFLLRKQVMYQHRQ